MAGIMRIRRSHGVLGGTLIALLGIWGALIPFVGPYFHYAYTPDQAWTFGHGRLVLEVLPGGGAFLGGVLLIYAMSRHLALFGASLGILSGAWFALGNVFAPLWSSSSSPAGVPAGATTFMRIMEQVGFFTGLGVVLVLLSAAVAGRITAVPRLVTEPEVIPAQPVSDEDADQPTRSSWWRRRPTTVDDAENADDVEETRVIR
jgi:hypothetical protein